ncbi:MAG TPA: MarR family transcriptional regulator [Solirubrobacter sp.]|nr:MarR family transcriptional regulator [Solirubrobacter sp.]
MIEELDLSFTQVKMLFLLEDGREHSVSELAAPLRLSVPTASRAVDGLIKRGIVTRRESASDRRSRLVALSDHGHAAAARLMHARLAMLATFVNEITPDEQAALLTALSPVLERIAPP